jgi:hypothetical protein
MRRHVVWKFYVNGSRDASVIPEEDSDEGFRNSSGMPDERVK